MSIRSHLIGTHLSTAAGWHTMFEYAQKLGCSAGQIFVKNARSWSRKIIYDKDVLEFRSAYAASSIKSIVAHAGYLINIASNNETTRNNSIACLENELELCSRMGIHYLVLHPGNYINQDPQSAIDIFTQNLNRVLNNSAKDVIILLENSAGQGSSLGQSFEELAQMSYPIHHKNLLGFCFDTCHAFAAGYLFDDQIRYQNMWKSFDQLLGMHKLGAIHINDSKNNYKSHVDRHTSLGYGTMTLNPFKLLMNDATFINIPKILETPLEKCMDDMEILRGLIQ